MLLAVSMLICSLAQAQVTIGSGTPPDKRSLPDLKEDGDYTGTNGATASKGLILSRVYLTERDKLKPMWRIRNK